jgi:N6-adenosine-specific RNA methylase IME4
VSRGFQASEMRRDCRVTVVASNYAEARPWFFAPLVPMSYEVLSIDPPWRFRTWSECNQQKSASKHYSLMMTDDIEALPVGQVAQRDCLVLLWVTAPMLPQGLECLRRWGATYKSNMVWRKTTASGKVRMGTGYWARSMHEQVLIGCIGKPRKFSAFPSLFDGIAREHSRKPDEFFRLVEKHTVGLRRADVFSRESRPGWDTFGNETGKFDGGSGEPNA